MQQQIKVKTEKMATRCEICHQSDLFNPQTESCLRCSQVEKALEANPQITRSLWSPRFALLERERSPVKCKNAAYLVAMYVLFISLMGALNAIFFDDKIFFYIISALSCMISVAMALRKLWKQQYVSSSSFTNDNTHPQITTLFDKYPEEEGFKRELPYNEPTITTLFGDNNRKNRY